MLKKIRQRKLYDDVVIQIEEAIISGEFKPNDKLPSERELEKLLGVSRGTIRQSLRLLEQKGLLVIKTGAHGGAFVKEITSELVSNSVSLLIRFNHVSPKHIASFRGDIEGQLIAKLAAENAQEEDILQLKFLLDQLMDINTQEELDWSTFDSLEHEMHVVLGSMTKNPLYEALSTIIMESMIHASFSEHMGRTKKVMDQVISDWMEIINRLEANDSRNAHRLISEHIFRWIKKYEQNKGKNKTTTNKR